MGLEILAGVHYHEQTAASTTWTITHNLNTLAPAVDCWVGGIKVTPLTVTATSALVCTITFASAQSGEAALT